MLLVLCVQLIKDSWGVSAMRLGKLCDIAETLRARSDVDWESLRERAQQAGVLRMVALALGVAEALLGAPVPETAPRVSNRALARTLVSRVVSRLFDVGGTDSKDPKPSARFHFMVRERDQATFRIPIQLRRR
jgi:hypothetical protein